MCSSLSAFIQAYKTLEGIFGKCWTKICSQRFFGQKKFPLSVLYLEPQYRKQQVWEGWNEVMVWWWWKICDTAHCSFSSWPNFSSNWQGCMKANDVLYIVPFILQSKTLNPRETVACVRAYNLSHRNLCFPRSSQSFSCSISMTNECLPWIQLAFY